MNRRNFIGSILALGVAPAIVTASSLMPVVVRGRTIEVFDMVELQAVLNDLHARDRLIVTGVCIDRFVTIPAIRSIVVRYCSFVEPFGMRSGDPMIRIGGAPR